MSDDRSSARTRDLGKRVAIIRTEAGLSGYSLSRQMRAGAPSLSRFERGLHAMSRDRLVQYLTLCGKSVDEIEPLLTLFNTPESGYHVSGFEDQLPDELAALVIHESTATTISQFENGVLPGLLQSADYIRALCIDASTLDADTIEKIVRIRMTRQQIHKRENPPFSAFFINERDLRLIAGNPSIMHDQMMNLFFACDWQNCSIRVVPTESYFRVGTRSSFRLMTFDDHGPVATESTATAMVFMEKLADIAVYRKHLDRLDQVALSTGQSKSLIAHLADEYGQMGATRDGRSVAEEQLQRRQR